MNNLDEKANKTVEQLEKIFELTKVFVDKIDKVTSGQHSSAEIALKYYQLQLSALNTLNYMATNIAHLGCPIRKEAKMGKDAARPQSNHERLVQRADLTELFLGFHAAVAEQYENRKTPDLTAVEELVNRSVEFTEELIENKLISVDTRRDRDADVLLRAEVANTLMAFREAVIIQHADGKVPSSEDVTELISERTTDIVQKFMSHASVEVEGSVVASNTRRAYKLVRDKNITGNYFNFESIPISEIKKGDTFIFVESDGTPVPNRDGSAVCVAHEDAHQGEPQEYDCVDKETGEESIVTQEGIWGLRASMITECPSPLVGTEDA